MRINAGGLSELMVGRHNEVTTLKAYIQMGQHCAIVGPRRYGKTTLVNTVLSDLNKEYLVITLDVFNASSWLYRRTWTPKAETLGHFGKGYF